MNDAIPQPEDVQTLLSGGRWARVADGSDAQRRASEEDDLQAGLTNLARLSSANLDLEAVLTRIAEYAVQAIPGAEGAGLTLLEDDRADTVVATTAFVRDVDEIQYSLGQGPCITAARGDQTIVSGSLGDDPRWRAFGRRVADLGVRSVLSLPLTTASVVGAMNVYAHARDAFDARAAALGETFAVPAAIAVENAQVLAHARRLAVSLQKALDNRAVIDRAVGIVMSRSGGTAEEAHARLLGFRSDRQPLTEVARQIVEAAVRRAEALRSGPADRSGPAEKRG